jgi:fructose/tagatose bisphosphate aldolase
MEDDMNISEDQADKVDVGTVRGFLSEVGVDALAVAIGSAHGFHKAEPKFGFDLLRHLVGCLGACQDRR